MSKRKRRSSSELSALADRIVASCVGTPSGMSALALGRKLRRAPRALHPALAIALASGRLCRTGEGRGTRYFERALPASPLGKLVGAKGVTRSARLLGVDRRTLLRWRRVGAIPDFHLLRISKLVAILGLE